MAEDVVQEAFLELRRHPERFDPTRADLQSWLRKIAHRRAVDRIRSTQSARDRDVRVGTRDHHDVDRSATSGTTPSDDRAPRGAGDPDHEAA